jgi:hypothetical protein
MRLKKLLGMALVAVTASIGLTVVTQTPAAAAVHGPYVVWPQHSGLCLRPAGGSTGNVVVEQANCNGSSASQWWAFIDVPGGYFRIRNEASNKCLNVQGGSTANSAKVIQYPCGGSGTLNDQWGTVYVRTTGNADYYSLVNRKSGRCMNIQGNTSAAGADLIQYTCSTAANSSFSWADLIIEP